MKGNENPSEEGERKGETAQSREPAQDKSSVEDFEALINYLKTSRGSDFTGYKRQSLMRRVRRRMQSINMASFSDYKNYLEVRPDEFSGLFNTILINVTSFFRDKPAWDYLAREIIPKIIASKKEGELIRIWSAGCASGEEAYSIAMIMAEALGEEEYLDRVKIFATDIDEAALAQARAAIYSSNEVDAVPKEMRDRYFEMSGAGYVFKPSLRRAVIFGRHDLLQDAPISHLDLLVCRNTLMYFNAEVQSKVLARFHFALNEDGYLFLGRAELLLTHTSLFTPLNLKCRIFVNVPKPGAKYRMEVMSHAGDYEVPIPLTRQVRLRESAFDISESAQIVIDLNGNLALANERARSLFSLDTGDLGKKLHDLEVSYRPIELRSLIERIYSDRRPLSVNKVERRAQEDCVQHFDVRLKLIQDISRSPLGVSIEFLDKTDFYLLKDELERSKHDLETAYEELQSTNEELETTNEELQSTVEELETTNEELQSTNEELETANEELQSTNEELRTMNEELRQRTDELNRANSFLESVFSSLNRGMIVLDQNYKVLVWNKAAEDMWGLRSDEVIGVALFTLDIGLPLARLKEPMMETQGDRKFRDFSLEAVNRRGKRINVRITIAPLLKAGHGVEGLIMVMEVPG